MSNQNKASNNSSFHKSLRISGTLRIKRNRIYVTRYVEIVDSSLSYYKNKGDNVSRYNLNLKGVLYSEDTNEDPGTITLVSKNPSKDSKDYLKFKFASDSEFKAWREVLLDVTKQTESELRREISNTIDPDNIPARTKLSRNLDEDKDVVSLQKPGFQKNSSSNSKNTSHGEEMMNNLSPRNAKQTDSTSIDTDIMVNNAGDSLPALKAQVFHFKKEGYEPSVLMNSQDNHRIFLGPKTKLVGKKQKDPNPESEWLKKARKLISVDEVFGPAYMYIMLGIMIALAFLAAYVILEIMGIMSLILILTFSLYLTNRKTHWINNTVVDLLETGGEKFSFLRVKETLLTQLSGQANYTSKGECKLKAKATIDASPNEILFCFSNWESRKYWQCHIMSVELNGQQMTIKYNCGGKNCSETFTMTVYKEDNQLYIVEHQDLRIIRIFELSLNGSPMQTNVTLYMKVSSTNITNLKLNESPLILSGLNSYIVQQKADATSEMSKKYKGNNNWLKDISNEREQLVMEGLHQEGHQTDDDDKSIKSRSSLSDAPAGDNASYKSSVIGNNEEGQAVTKRAKHFQDCLVKIKERWNQLAKVSKEPGWEQLENNQDISIMMNQVTDNELKIVTEVTIKMNIEKVLEILEKPDEWMKYDELLEKGRVVEKLNENLNLEYLKYNKDSCFSSYDYVSLQQKISEQNGKYQLLFGSIDDEALPVVQDCVRIDVKCGTWILHQAEKEAKITKVTYVLWVDFKEALQSNWIKKAARNQAHKVLLFKQYVEKN